ncbi:MAG TPA: tetratricopeptide repeat protein [Terriglobales bacterium]|nr:tetratricopeptide repeat protein [Terriglobales bacterium]
MAKEREVEKSRPQSSAHWTSAQAYALAVFCLGFGLVLGYLFRGSAPVTSTASAANPAEAAGAPAGMPGVPNSLSAPGTGQLSPEQTSQMVEKAAQPLLQSLKQNPRDFEILVKLGNLYYDSKLYPESIKYYELALKVRPENSDVRTDMGTAYWYSGNPDRALAEFNRALKYNPTHPGTLFNMGVVKWQGKMDPSGAVQAWERLLKTNPNYPQKQQVLDLIDRARQHAKG